MAKKKDKRELEMDTLILPAIKMVLTETDESKNSGTKVSAQRNVNRPNQKTVLRIIEALNKAD
jgi:hypothetical protein